ncbi:MAG: intermembrane phospholipid transport protein YdbH family protein [Janthinobacterium lividum]
MTRTGERTPPRRRAIRRPIAGGLLVVVVGGVSTLWLVRVPIATSVIDRRLAEAHVPAHYRIADLGLGRQRLVDVSVGDPARPDLTARWIELGTRIGLDGARVTAVRAGGMRLRATMIGGRLSLGSLDRLMPSSTSAGGVRLPAIDLDVEDGRLRLATGAGTVDVGLRGSGRLDGGFDGRLTVGVSGLVAGGCGIDRLSAALRLRVRAGEPEVGGPVQVAAARCGGASATDLTGWVAATLGSGLASWRGTVRTVVASVTVPGLRVTTLTGNVAFEGNAARTQGTVALASGPAVMARGGRADGLTLAGSYGVGRDWRFVGRAAASGASLPRPWLAVLAGWSRSAMGTPVGPLVARATLALAAAGRAFDASADLATDGTSVALSRAEARARSGATMAFAGGSGLATRLRTLRPVVDGTVRFAGGGLPAAVVRLAQARVGAPITGEARVEPYAAGDARVTATPVRFSADPAGRTTVDTVATLSGPLTSGRIEGLVLPIVIRRDAGGVLTIDPGCATIRFDRLALGSVRLAGARVPLCSTGAATVSTTRGRLAAGARLGPVRLAGSIGATPLSLAFDGGTVDWSRRAFSLSGVAARLGAADAATRLDVGELGGALTGDGIQGRFARAGGRIGTVPLLLSGADGTWRERGGALGVDGTMTVGDTSPRPRFEPLRAEAMTLTLEDGTILVRGRLVSPAEAVPVADVAITHDLAAGSGSADLVVPRLVFDERFQPDALTPLTFGVIADVRGTIDGRARIAWGRDGVSSTGSFHTDGTDLAAAFGPVAGIAGTIRFTDLLSLTSAPDQTVTLASVNPGIAVTDGRVVFQTLPDSRVRVTSGHWPFAGGSLDLRPTLLDFSAATTRRMTFTLTGVDAGRFLQQFDFANVSATGVFDGALPMAFDAAGGRIENGDLRVRPGGGSLAYVGELTQKDLGTWGNLAFQALRSIDYRNLSIAMNGPLDGEMVTAVRFAGISQGKGAKSNFVIRRLQRLPFVFNIQIRAPFRGLIDSAQSFYDPSRLIERNLPMLLQQQAASRSQPAESNTVP